MTKIGNRVVAFSTMLLVPDEQLAEVGFSVENWPMKLLISFHPQSAADNTIEWSLEGDGLRARCNRWDNSLGTILSEPAVIGKSPSGKSIELLLFQHRVGNLNRLDVQVTVGDQS